MPLPKNTRLPDDKGILVVEGSTSAEYHVINTEGLTVARQKLNEPTVLIPGQYEIVVNQSRHQVTVDAGMKATCSTGSLTIAGHTSDSYHVTDSTGRVLAGQKLGKPVSLFPDMFTVIVNNTKVSARVKLRTLTEIRTGTLTVTGSTGEQYYVLDDSNKQLSYAPLGKSLAFFPGRYVLKLNNTSLEAEVFASQFTQIGTGNLLVYGLTEEFYYVTDTTGHALNFQHLNKALSFFPGKYRVRVNNTLVEAAISENETTQFATGSIMLTGQGTEYYYVLDHTGAALNYNSLNKSLSLFPAEYSVKLGSSIRKATVRAGKLTSISTASQGL